MRNANEKGQTETPPVDEIMRPTFEAPRSLVEAFRAVAKRNDRTLSAELRQRMRDAIEADRKAA